MAVVKTAADPLAVAINNVNDGARREALHRVSELLRTGLDLRDRHAAGEVSRHGSAVAHGRLENELSALVWPLKTNAANERLAQHLWNHRDDLFTFLRQPGLDATN